jgi:transcriptional regulator with XRE-family HTH domain
MAEEARLARIGAGLSQRFVARAIGVSHSAVGRFERGQLERPSLEFLATYCAVVGLDLSLKAYPGGDPLRDRPSLVLLGRFRTELHPSLGWRTEVPLALPRDPRAWDAEIRGAGWRAFVEAETRLSDAQALARRLALKIRDGGADCLILVLNETRRTRLVLGGARESLRPLLPFDTRDILGALRAGRQPPGSGIVVL